MRTQEEVLTRRRSIEDDLEDDMPAQVERALEAQRDILTWVLEGDTLPDEYRIEGELKHTEEVFDEVILAGVDGGGRVYRAASCDEKAHYLLARRPSREEWEREKRL